MFHSFFNSLARSRFLSFFSLFFSILHCGQPGQQSPHFCNFCFLLTIIRSGLLAKIRWSVCISKSQRGLYVSFSRTDSGLCIYHFFIWSNSNFLHNSLWINLPTHSCLVLYSFCASLLHSLIMWLIVSFLSPHNLHLLFCWVLSILVGPYGVVVVVVVVVVIIIIIIRLLASCFKPIINTGSRDIKSPQVSWILLSIRVGFNDPVVCMSSILLISNSSSHLS